MCYLVQGWAQSPPLHQPVHILVDAAARSDIPYSTTVSHVDWWMLLPSWGDPANPLPAYPNPCSCMCWLILHAILVWSVLSSGSHVLCAGECCGLIEVTPKNPYQIQTPIMALANTGRYCNLICPACLLVLGIFLCGQVLWPDPGMPFYFLPLIYPISAPSITCECSGLLHGSY